jgi:hypothetical protein
MVFGAQAEFPAEAIILFVLGIDEGRFRGGEIPGAVHPRFIEEEREEVVSQIIVSLDVHARLGHVVRAEAMKEPLEWLERGTEAAV